MQQHEILAWLGPAADEMTPEQIDRFATEADKISARYPEDQQEERDAAMSATAQYMLGETTIEDAGWHLAAARRAKREAMAAAQQIAAMVVDDRLMSEVAAAQAAQINRMTLRKALGKL